VLALAQCRRLVSVESVSQSTDPRLPELEILFLVLLLDVVDDELLTAVVTVAEDSRLVFVWEFVEVESNYNRKRNLEVFDVFYLDVSAQVNAAILTLPAVQFGHFIFLWGLGLGRFGPSKPEVVVLSSISLHK